MKVFHSLDFSSQKARIEKTPDTPYLVHLEDYESINDTIARSIRIGHKYRPENDMAEYAQYDEDFLSETQSIIDRTGQDEPSEADQGSADKQSEVSEPQTAEQVVDDLLL